MLILSVLLWLTASDSTKKCYLQVDEDMCPICKSRGKYTCGYCLSMFQCLQGNENGPTEKDFTCPKEDWIVNKTSCSNEICHLSKNENTCRLPCQWNRWRKECFRPRDMDKDTKQEKTIEKTVITTRLIFLSVLCLLVVFAIISFVYICWFSKKPLYRRLPNMEHEVTLDDLPRAF